TEDEKAAIRLNEPFAALAPTSTDVRCSNTSNLVELRGFEPLTSSMPWKRATNCAIAPYRVPPRQATRREYPELLISGNREPGCVTPTSSARQRAHGGAVRGRCGGSSRGPRGRGNRWCRGPAEQ